MQTPRPLFDKFYGPVCHVFFHPVSPKKACITPSENTYVRVTLRDRMCRPTRTYVWAHTYVRVFGRGRWAETSVLHHPAYSHEKPCTRPIYGVEKRT